LGGHKPGPATTVQPKTDNTTMINKSGILQTNQTKILLKTHCVAN